MGLRFPAATIRLPFMRTNKPLMTMREILDRLDVVREELLSLQLALEKLARSLEATPGSNVVTEGNDVGP
jgi:hypothetical protein